MKNFTNVHISKNALNNDMIVLTMGLNNVIKKKSYVEMTEDNLRRLLRERNRLWRRVGINNTYLLNRAKSSKNYSKSNTGYSCIRTIKSVDRSEDIKSIRIAIHKLNTGARTVRTIQLDDYPSYEKAIVAARVILEENIASYNDIVDLYNRYRRTEFMQRAKEELKTLVPVLHHMKGFQKDLWERAYVASVRKSVPWFARKPL